MKSISFVLLTLFFGCFDYGVGAFQEQDTKTIDSYIARQARQEQGEEYRDARKVVVGNLDNDSNPETVVLYTIESQRGTNNHVQYMAVFVQRNSPGDVGLRPKGRVMLSEHQGQNSIYSRRPNLARTEDP